MPAGQKTNSQPSVRAPWEAGAVVVVVEVVGVVVVVVVEVGWGGARVP
jgi:hypothetical protein